MLSPTGLVAWSSKTEGNTYATIAASPFPLQGKPTQAQDVAFPSNEVSLIIFASNLILFASLLFAYIL